MLFHMLLSCFIVTQNVHCSLLVAQKMVKSVQNILGWLSAGWPRGKHPYLSAHNVCWYTVSVVDKCQSNVVRRYAFIKYDFQGGQVWIETGVMIRTTDFWHFVPVYDIVTAILKVLCDILPSVHALTGCDCTSAFFNIGKMLVYMLVRNNANRYKDLIKLGESVLQAISHHTCMMEIGMTLCQIT